MTAVINLVSSLVSSHFLMERSISDPQLQMSKADLSLLPASLPILLSLVTPSGPAACPLVDKWVLLGCDLGAQKSLDLKYLLPCGLGISSSVLFSKVWAKGLPLQIQDYKCASELGLVNSSPKINHPDGEGALTHYLPKLWERYKPDACRPIWAMIHVF